MARAGGDEVIYLAYGSNLWPRRLAERIGAFTILGSVSLPGWCLKFNKRGTDGSAKANLVPVADPDRHALAAAYRIPAAAREVLDRHEGRGRGYELLAVVVPEFGTPGVIYVSPVEWQIVDEYPYDWYRDLIVAGARYHAFPETYIESLRSHPARPDRDRRRADGHLSLLGGRAPEIARR